MFHPNVLILLQVCTLATTQIHHHIGSTTDVGFNQDSFGAIVQISKPVQVGGGLLSSGFSRLFLDCIIMSRHMSRFTPMEDMCRPTNITGTSLKLKPMSVYRK